MASAAPFPYGDATGLPYDLVYDRVVGLITLRPLRALVDSDAVRLCRDLDPLLVAMREDWGDLRVLFDMRDTSLFAGMVRAKMVETVDRRRIPGDRFAVIVSSSVIKAQVKLAMDEQSQPFLSHTAAMTWLNAWVGIDQPATGYLSGK